MDDSGLLVDIYINSCFWQVRKQECLRGRSLRFPADMPSNFQFLEENMRINFNEIASMTFPGMDNGIGMMSARMYNDDSYRIIPTAIHPGGSIGNHKQNSGDDMNYIISGTGKAFCDGMEEDLKPGVMHICPQGSEHSIVNTGEEDLVMLTIVVKK